MTHLWCSAILEQDNVGIVPYATHQRNVILKKYSVILRSGATKDLVEITVGDPSLRSG